MTSEERVAGFDASWKIKIESISKTLGILFNRRLNDFVIYRGNIGQKIQSLALCRHAAWRRLEDFEPRNVLGDWWNPRFKKGINFQLYGRLK